MSVRDEFNGWAGRLCLGLVGALGFMGYHFANVRFVPIAVGFAILAGVCYADGRAGDPDQPLEDTGSRPAI